MKKVVLLFLLSIGVKMGYSQSGIDSALFKKIDQMFREDQKWRLAYSHLNINGKSEYSEEVINKNWASTDRLNMAEAKRIIDQYGYPGYALVGKRGSGRFWAIVQHCDDDLKFQEKVLKLMDAAVRKKDADAIDFAYLTDRVLVSRKKKQVYGTQTRLNKETHKYVPFPIAQPETLDQRRKSIGLASLAEYLKSMNDRL